MFRVLHGLSLEIVVGLRHFDSIEHMDLRPVLLWRGLCRVADWLFAFLSLGKCMGRSVFE